MTGVSTHLSCVIVLLSLVFLHHAGEAAGVGRRPRNVLCLWDGRSPATHRQTTHAAFLRSLRSFPRKVWLHSFKGANRKKNIYIYTSHLFLVAGNSGELGLDEVSGLFSRMNWLLSRVFWALGDTSRLEDVLGEGRKYIFDVHRTS